MNEQDFIFTQDCPGSIESDGGFDVIVDLGGDLIDAPDVDVVFDVDDDFLVETGGAPLAAAFQNLFIGYQNEFPAVAHPSLLYKKGDFPSHPTFYRKYLKDEA